MGNAKVQINIQAKSNLAEVLSASTKAANGTYAALKRLNGVKLPNFGKSIADSLKSAAAPAKQLSSNYQKAERHAKGLYDATKAMGRLKRPVWQTQVPASPMVVQTSGRGMSKESLKLAEDYEVRKALWRQAQKKEADEAKHKKAMERAEKEREKARAKAAKEQGGRWKQFSSSIYRVQSLMDRIAFFGSVALNQMAFPLFGGIKGFAQQSFNTIGDMRRMSMQLGMTAGQISNFQRIIQEQGGTQEDANEALMTFNERMRKAGTGEGVPFLTLLGRLNFQKQTGGLKDTASFLQEWLTEFGKKMAEPGDETQKRHWAAQYTQFLFGRGGEYLYTGIRKPGDYAADMARESYAPTEGQADAWKSITSQMTDVKLQLMQKGYEFVERNKEFISDTINQSMALANTILGILQLPGVLPLLKWSIVGIGSAIGIGSIVALVTNFGLAIKVLALALKGGGFMNFVKAMIGLSPSVVQSTATKAFVTGAAKTAAGSAAGGVAASAAGGAGGAATVAGRSWLARSGAWIINSTREFVGGVYKKSLENIPKIFQKELTSPSLARMIGGPVSLAVQSLLMPTNKGPTEGSDIWNVEIGNALGEQINATNKRFGNKPLSEEEKWRHDPANIGSTMKDMRYWLESHSSSSKSSQNNSLKLDITVHNDTGNKVDAKVNGGKADGVTLRTNLYNHIPVGLGEAPLYA